MSTHDFSSIVDTAIAQGERGLRLKTELKAIIEGFIAKIGETLTSKFASEFTLKQEHPLERETAASIFFSAFSAPRKKDTFDVFIIHKSADGSAEKRFKLFSYEYNSQNTLPVKLMYNDATQICVDEGKLIAGLSEMLSNRAVSMMEWCLAVK